VSLRARLARGVTVGPVIVSVRRSRRANSEDEVSGAALARHVARITVLFPALGDMVNPLLAAEPRAVRAVLGFCNDYVALVHEPAREVQLRNILVRLREKLTGDDSRQLVDQMLARSNLRSGVPDRAVLLEALPEDDPVRQALKIASEEHDALYGARGGMIRSSAQWAGPAGDVRGRSLVERLERLREDLRGTSVLHVAPEAEARQWLTKHATELGFDYRTLDAFSSTEDLQEDLTRLSLSDASVDYVICHRVLEHILDDRSALAEIYRVLRARGTLETSVPQSMQLAETNEWVMQDESHHGHVRQYGRDFEQRLADAGFDVEVDRMLLDRPLSEHLVAGTFPLRIYLCRKS
jgi:SAM-dependent methyltransferase